MGHVDSPIKPIQMLMIFPSKGTAMWLKTWTFNQKGGEMKRIIFGLGPRFG
jgi:hypothetical protein